MISVDRFRQIEAELRKRGYGEMIEWSESIQVAANPDDFANRAIYVICNSGMSVAVGTTIHKRCMEAIISGGSATSVFAHPGKAPAIDVIWADREALFRDYQTAEDPIEFLERMPWIGKVTRHHLAKNLGPDEAKPDVHMERLARRENTTTRELCERLALLTKFRVATVDSILWRACADGILNSRLYESEGWEAAFNSERQASHD